MNAKEAAERAANYLAQLIPLGGRPQVEEVSKDGDHWLITLSYMPSLSTGAYLLGGGREYKVFDIDGNGEVVSMKMRNLKE